MSPPCDSVPHGTQGVSSTCSGAPRKAGRRGLREQFLLASHHLHTQKTSQAFGGLPRAGVQGGAGQMGRAPVGLPFALWVTEKDHQTFPAQPALLSLSCEH